MSSAGDTARHFRMVSRYPPQQEEGAPHLVSIETCEQIIDALYDATGAREPFVAGDYRSQRSDLEVLFHVDCKKMGWLKNLWAHC